MEQDPLNLGPFNSWHCRRIHNPQQYSCRKWLNLNPQWSQRYNCKYHIYGNLELEYIDNYNDLNLIYRSKGTSGYVKAQTFGFVKSAVQRLRRFLRNEMVWKLMMNWKMKISDSLRNSTTVEFPLHSKTACGCVYSWLSWESRSIFRKSPTIYLSTFSTIKYSLAAQRVGPWRCFWRAQVRAGCCPLGRES